MCSGQLSRHNPFSPPKKNYTPALRESLLCSHFGCFKKKKTLRRFLTFRERDFRGPEVVQVARTVENNRSAQSHALNHRSSRSHCLITLSLRQIDAKGGNPMDSWAHRAGLLGGLLGGCGKAGVVNCQTAGTGWYSINSSMNSTTHLGMDQNQGKLPDLGGTSSKTSYCGVRVAVAPWEKR